MRVLGSTVLVFEWLILALAVPVAINTADVRAPAAWLFLAVATVLIIAAVGTITRPTGVTLGWVVQGVIVVAALVVPLLPLIVLGVLFAALWYAAIRLSARVEAVKAARAAAAADPRGGTPAASTETPVGDTGPVGDNP